MEGWETSQGAHYVPPLPAPDMSIVDTVMRDEVLKADYRERAKTINKLNTEKPMLYAFITSKLSAESEDELKRHTSYKTIDDDKDPLELWKALEELHLVTRGTTPSHYSVKECRGCTSTIRE